MMKLCRRVSTFTKTIYVTVINMLTQFAHTLFSGDHIELCRLRKKKKYIQIFCVSKLLILLLKLRYKTPAADLELLDAYLCPSDDLFEFEDHVMFVTLEVKLVFYFVLALLGLGR